MPNLGLAVRSYALRILCASSTRHLQCPALTHAHRSPLSGAIIVMHVTEDVHLERLLRTQERSHLTATVDAHSVFGGAMLCTMSSYCISDSPYNG